MNQKEQKKLESELRGMSCFRSVIFKWKSSIESTSDEIKKTIGLEPCQVVMSQHQTAGRGQFDRVWVSEKSQGLLFSFSGLETDFAFPLSLKAAIAVSQALKSFGINDFWLKWPNDIWHSNAKLGGILTETSVSGKRQEYIIGVGINVMPLNHKSIVSADLSNLGFRKRPEELLVSILSKWCDICQASPEQLCALWTDYAGRFWHIVYKLYNNSNEFETVCPVKLTETGELVVFEKRTKKTRLLSSGSLVPVF